MAEAGPTPGEPRGGGHWRTVAVIALLAAAAIGVHLALTAPAIVDSETLSYIAAWALLTLLIVGFAPRRSRGKRGLRWLGVACIALGAPAVLIGGCIVNPLTQLGQFAWFAAVTAIIALGFYLVRRADRS